MKMTNIFMQMSKFDMFVMSYYDVVCLVTCPIAYSHESVLQGSF